MSEETDTETEEILKGSIAQSEGQYAPGDVSPDEFSRIMGQIHYFLTDDIVTKLAYNDSRVKKLLPVLSHLVRTSRCHNEKRLYEMKLRWRIACRLELLILPENPASMGEFHSWLTYGYTVFEDMREGWRGKLAAERVRTYKIETGGPKQRKKVLGIF